MTGNPEAAASGELNQTCAANASGHAAGEILTVDELATLLRVNKKTVYDAIRNGEIPGVRKIGSIFRISKSKVLAWLAEGHGRVSPKRRRK